jgi:hypothetical protein
MVVDLTNQAFPLATGFAEQIKNTSSTLAAADTGFTNAADTVTGASSINKGMAAGFVARSTDDPAEQAKFDKMDEQDFKTGMGNATAGMMTLALNANLLGNEDKLVEAMTAGTQTFATEAIKVSASDCLPHSTPPRAPSSLRCADVALLASCLTLTPPCARCSPAHRISAHCRP